MKGNLRVAANVLRPYFSSGLIAQALILKTIFMTNKKISNEAQKPALRKGDVSGSFVYVRHPFNSRSHARQEMVKMKARGLISNYRIAWDAQLRMTVEVVYTDKCCDAEMHRRLRDEFGHWKCRNCGMLL